MSAMGGGSGLANWQWLFLLEGIPSLVMGLVILACVVDTPSQAGWLTNAEKELVLTELAADRRQAGPQTHTFDDALRTPRVWLFTLIYFCLVSVNPTLGFWGPTIIADLGVTSNTMIGLLSAMPFVASAIGIVWVGRHSDQMLERRFINSIGNLSGWIGPFAVGWFKDLTGKTSTGLYIVAGLEVAATVLILLFIPQGNVRTTAVTGG